MSSPEPPRPKPPSLKDFLVRYDLAALLAEARLDYSSSTSGGPRHLEQKDIAARFRLPRPAVKTPDEPG